MNNNAVKKKADVRFLTKMAMLVAIQIIMFYTPLGMLPLPGQYASLLTVPVAIGAMLLGPLAGTVLGFIFGILSFWKSLQTGTLIGAGVGIVSIMILTIATRTLMGFLTGILFKVIEKIDRTNMIKYFAGGLLAPVLNTILYMTTYVVILLRTPLLQALLSEQMLETLKHNALLFVFAYVGVQALIEAGVGCVVSGLVGKALNSIGKRTGAGNNTKKFTTN